jgi:1,4-dihydroxy-2-naphthoate octaprenyltransferase
MMIVGWSLAILGVICIITGYNIYTGKTAINSEDELKFLLLFWVVFGYPLIFIGVYLIDEAFNRYTEDL